MCRHSIGAEAAFQPLSDHSQHNGRKLIDAAAAVVRESSPAGASAGARSLVLYGAGLARDQGAPMVSLKAQKPKKTLRGK